MTREREPEPMVACCCCGRLGSYDAAVTVHLDGRATTDEACRRRVGVGCPLCADPLEGDDGPLVIVAGRLGHLDCYESARRQAEDGARSDALDYEHAVGTGGTDEG